MTSRLLTPTGGLIRPSLNDLRRYGGGGGGAPAPRDPIDPDATGLTIEYWWEAEKESYNDTDAVTSITDYGGGGRHASSGSNHPTYRTNIINGNAVFRFDGVNDQKLTAGGTASGLTDWTMCGAYNPTSLDTSAWSVRKDGGGYAAPITSGRVQFSYSDGGKEGYWAHTGTPGVGGGWQVRSAIIKANVDDCRVFWNNEEGRTQTGNTDFSMTNQSGSRHEAGGHPQLFGGDLFGVVVLQGLLDDDTLLGLQNYYLQKIGFPLGSELTTE